MEHLHHGQLCPESCAHEAMARDGTVPRIHIQHNSTDGSLGNRHHGHLLCEYCSAKFGFGFDFVPFARAHQLEKGI